MRIVLSAGLIQAQEPEVVYSGTEEGLGTLVLAALRYGEEINEPHKIDMPRLLAAAREERPLTSGELVCSDGGGLNWGIRHAEPARARRFAMIWRDDCWQVWFVDSATRAAFQRFAINNGLVHIQPS